MLSKNDNLGQLANDVVRLDADSKKFICEMFEKADFNISDIYIKEEKVRFLRKLWRSSES